MQHMDNINLVMHLVNLFLWNHTKTNLNWNVPTWLLQLHRLTRVILIKIHQMQWTHRNSVISNVKLKRCKKWIYRLLIYQLDLLLDFVHLDTFAAVFLIVTISLVTINFYYQWVRMISYILLFFVLCQYLYINPKYSILCDFTKNWILLLYSNVM